MTGSSTCGNAETFQVFKALSHTLFVMETILPVIQMEKFSWSLVSAGEGRVCVGGGHHIPPKQTRSSS